MQTEVGNRARLFWVIALRPEAKSLWQNYAMKPMRDDGPFPMHQSKDGRHISVLSGVGKVNAAAATIYAHQAAKSQPYDGWLNLGIAGSSEHSVGDLVMANKIVDDAQDKCWYPRWVLKKRVGASLICTVDKPRNNYPATGTVEMEAAGFYPTALRIAQQELIQALKVVSDSPDSPHGKVDAGMVDTLMRKRWPQIHQVASELLRLGEECDRPTPHLWQGQLEERLHFSVTQRHRLEKLLNRALAIGPAGEEWIEKLHHAQDASHALQVLERELTLWFEEGRAL